MYKYSSPPGRVPSTRADTPACDPATIRAALDLLFESGHVVELRMLGVDGRHNHVDSGYFDDMDALAASAARYEGRAAGTYITLNPVNPALLARACNRVEQWAKQTTGDSDIVQRRWLPIDFDPVRPSGISASDEEHAAALARAKTVRDALRGEGWPRPILADSGNGAHLLYRVDLPAADDGCVARSLASLSFRFSDDRVKVDEAVHNPARIWKLYGTLARKGDNTPDRPHRRAHLVEVPRW